MRQSQYERRNNLIILEDEETWPIQVIDYPTNHHNFFLNREHRTPVDRFSEGDTRGKTVCNY